MFYVVYAWLGLLGYGLSVIIGKATSKYHLKNPWLYNFVWSVAIVLFICIIVLPRGINVPHDWTSVWILGFLSALSGALYVLTLYSLDVSVLAPLYSFRTPIGALLAYFLFRETLTQYQSGLIFVITIAGLFVTMDEHFNIRSFFRFPVALALLSVFVSSLYSIAIKNAMIGNSYWSVTLWSNILTLPFVFITIPLFWKEIKKTRYRNYTGAFASGLAASLGGLAVYKAFSVNVTITMAITSIPSSMIMAFILSFIAPKFLEKHSLKVYAVRFTATTIMIVSALLLSK